jgi:hypothetical protein
VYWSNTKHECTGVLGKYYLLTRVLYFLSGNGFVFAGAKSLQEIEYNFDKTLSTIKMWQLVNTGKHHNEKRIYVMLWKIPKKQYIQHEQPLHREVSEQKGQEYDGVQIIDKITKDT